MTYQYHHQAGADCVCLHGSQEHLNRGTCLHSDKDTTWCDCEQYVELTHTHTNPDAVQAKGFCRACDHYSAAAQAKARQAMVLKQQKANMLRSKAMMGNTNARKR
jgi:hypothetical protein